MRAQQPKPSIAPMDQPHTAHDIPRDREAHVEWMLDAALEATFPASDPVAITAAANYTLFQR
jgi:hypothetical protein